jgi:hypothetical protein
MEDEEFQNLTSFGEMLKTPGKISNQISKHLPLMQINLLTT